MNRLTCAVCGDACRGRQWWNRDDGFGVCPRCWREAVKREGLDEATRLYGKPGENHEGDA
jgi:hypothetical protein